MYLIELWITVVVPWSLIEPSILWSLSGSRKFAHTLKMFKALRIDTWTFRLSLWCINHVCQTNKVPIFECFSHSSLIPGVCKKKKKKSVSILWQHASMEVFQNEILLAWQKDLNVEVILISEFTDSDPYFWIHRFKNKDHFNIYVFLLS